MTANGIINWLLEGPAWLKYAVKRQLLGQKPDVRAAVQDEAITKIRHRLKTGYTGFSALGTGKTSYTDTGNVYWDLFFLADIGFSADDLKLPAEMERIFQQQKPDGSFITDHRVMPNYFCMAAILLSSVAKMGYRDDPRLERYIQVILKSQLKIGGWHCFEDFTTYSCPMENMNILMLLGQYQRYQQDPRLYGAIDSLLEHWERQDSGWRPAGFGVGPRFKSLLYPAVKYGILRVLDALSLFPYATRSKTFPEMLDFVHRKSPDGRYLAEDTVSAYAEFDFGQKKEPSRWITFLVSRIEKRAGQYR